VQRFDAPGDAGQPRALRSSFIPTAVGAAPLSGGDPATCAACLRALSFRQKPYRKAMMEAFGARCVASPSPETRAGRSVLEEHPDSTGSLGIAISEAVERAAERDDTNYALGSVLNHVLMHQSVIGMEAQRQMEMADVYPDVIIGCTGGGSNFAGIALNVIDAENKKGNADPHTRYQTGNNVWHSDSSFRLVPTKF
jgi:predicted alternative tryptophan synthase beta-subunit